MTRFASDLALSLRSMLRRPLMPLASVATLAPALAAAGLGVGLAWTILLRPLPHPESGRLAVVEHTWAGFGVTGISGPLYRFYREHARTIDRLGLVSWTNVNLASATGGARRVPAVQVTAATLGLLGARPAAGRLFAAEDDRAGGPPVVLLTRALWQEAFGARADVVGSTVDVDGRSVTVAGVLESGVEFPGGEPRLVLPAGLDRAERSLLDIRWWYALARLAPGTTPEAAERELGDLLRRATVDVADGATTVQTLEANGIGPVVTGLLAWQTAGAGDFVLLLLVAVGVLLVLAVAAVTNLLVSRHEARSGDLRIRRVLGAPDARLLVHLAGEALVLCGAAGVAGAIGAWFVTDMVLAAGALDLPRVDVPWLPAATAGGAALLAASLVPLFGLVSLWWVRRDRGSLGGVRVTAWTGTRKVLLGVQLAASTVLLVAALSLGSSVRALARTSLGFRTEGVLTFQVSLPDAAYTAPERARAFHRAVVEGIRSLPGVVSAGHADGLPVPDLPWGGAMISPEGFPEDDARPTHWWGHVSDGFLATLGIPLLAGRPLTASETETSAPRVIVNEALATRYWQSAEDAVGRRFRRGAGQPWIEIVGVAANTAGDGTGAEPAPLIYAPRGLARWTDLTHGVYAVRTTLPPAALIASVRRIAAAVDGRVPVYDMAAMQSRVNASRARERLALKGVGVAGVASVVVVTASLGGLVLLTIAQRRREIGIRKAVGASDSGLQWFLVREVLTPATVGLVVGATAVLWGARVPPTLLHGAVAGDAWLPAAAAALLGLVVVVGLAASRRVVAVDPGEALRAE